MKTKSKRGSMLAADDLRIGSYMMVHSEVPPRVASPEEFGRHLAAQMAPGRRPPPMGVPLKVRAVCLPFVTCGMLKPGGGEAGPVILDVRGVRLMKVSAEYVESIREFRGGGADRGGAAPAGAGEPNLAAGSADGEEQKEERQEPPTA
jgi:hypothetical protein